MGLAGLATDKAPLKLSAREERFAREYVRDHNYGAAFKRSGIPGYESNPSQGGSLLARDPRVASRIAELEDASLEASMRAANLELGRLFTEIARGAFFDVRRLFHEDGSPKGVHELDEDIASAIAGIEVTEVPGPDGEPIRRFRYKLADRAKWADMGMKALGGYKRDNEQANPVNALVDLLQGMRRSAIPVVDEVPRDDAL